MAAAEESTLHHDGDQRHAPAQRDRFKRGVGSCSAFPPLPSNKGGERRRGSGTKRIACVGGGRPMLAHACAGGVSQRVDKTYRCNCWLVAVLAFLRFGPLLMRAAAGRRRARIRHGQGKTEGDTEKRKVPVKSHALSSHRSKGGPPPQLHVSVRCRWCRLRKQSQGDRGEFRKPKQGTVRGRLAPPNRVGIETVPPIPENLRRRVCVCVCGPCVDGCGPRSCCAASRRAAGEDGPVSSSSTDGRS